MFKKSANIWVEIEESKLLITWSNLNLEDNKEVMNEKDNINILVELSKLIIIRIDSRDLSIGLKLLEVRYYIIRHRKKEQNYY